ncbi:MAG: VCBS repeat-containing protein [Bacteroidaceae bacterium]|nr:VCBS repeat-containing protein [Bacteroidaceae bacterium]
MKFSTLTSATFVAALLASGAAQAQSVTFEQDRSARDAIGWPSHRATPVVADFNGDGIMDVYYGGTSCTNGWQVRGVLVKGLGGGAFGSDLEPAYEDYETQERVPMTDDQGNIVTDDNGDVVYLTDDTGEFIYQTVTRQRVVGMKNGLPFSAYGMASQTLDFNQDGLIDMLIQNIGGNDTGTEQGLVLVKNNGRIVTDGGEAGDDFSFSVVADSVLASLTMNGAGDGWNESNEYGAVAIGDYDNDGFPDILYQTWGWNRADDQWRRDVALLHNVGGTGFEIANVFRPMPSDVPEPNRIGIYEKTLDTITFDEDGVEIVVPGQWTDTPTYAIKRMSNGNVNFIDLNNDGWLDIVVTGWADGDDTERGGYELRYYENTRDGWFHDATHLLIPSVTDAAVSDVTSVWDTWGGTDNIITVIDYDQDGRQDLLLMGSAVGREGKQAYVLFNRGEQGDVVLEEHATKLVPQSGLGCRTFILADFNGDDVCDNFTRGWTSYEGRNDWAEAISISRGGMDNYDITVHGHESNFNGAFVGERTTSFGDLNGDGKLDIIATGWTDKGDDFIPSYNQADFTPAAPEKPEGLGARVEDGNLIVTWDVVSLTGTYGDALYNVYVRNNATGALRQVVPANLATGAQLGYSRFGAYVPGLGSSQPQAMKIFAGMPDGSYTVGVQAVSYTYAASPFATITVDIDNGIARVRESGMQLYRQGSMLVVAAPGSTQPVAVYSAAGQQVAAGVTGTPVALPAQGTYIVRCGSETLKVRL